MAVLSDPISDFLTRLKNASLAGNEEFTAPCSNIKVEIARILQEVDEDGKGDVPCAESCGWMVPT